MQDIKFRVWTGNQMEHHVLAGALGAFYVPGLDPEDSTSVSPLNSKFNTQAPIMQFIGQTDQYGTDIYEGDILTITIYGCLTSKNKQFVVEFLDSAFQFINIHDSSEGYYWIDIEEGSTKVIGNIYENPELLTQ